MSLTPDTKQTEELVNELKNHGKIMVLAGQSPMSTEIIDSLKTIQKNFNWVLIGDIIANIHELEHAITSHDIMLNNSTEDHELKPELLITFGHSILSKNLKNFIRTHQPVEHWHIGQDQEVVDTFKSLTKKVLLNPNIFFRIIEKSALAWNKSQINYFNYWKEKDVRARTYINDFFETEKFSEFHAVQKIVSQLPETCHLHLANSMTVRYANYLKPDKKKISIWSNRGTSGIDGCLSTAVGHAINTNCLNVIVTGDLAFFYDRNALWHNHVPDNLRIIILNNHGGGIFRLINGPNQLEELEEFFETNQKLVAANTARDFGMKYFNVKSLDALPGFLEQFFDEKAGPSILEIETDPKINQQVFENFKQKSAQLWK